MLAFSKQEPHNSHGEEGTETNPGKLEGINFGWASLGGMGMTVKFQYKHRINIAKVSQREKMEFRTI